MPQKTSDFNLKYAQERRQWHHIDADGNVLGRIATQAATWLKGKHKRFFSPSVDCGDFVVVTNVAKIKLTGNKLEQKGYFSHSGYARGAKVMPMKLQMERDPRKVVFLAVKRMLTSNRLRDPQLKRLKLYAGLVAFCAVAATIAVVLSARAVGREVEVARVRSDLVRNVSHELRTPVASILMLAEVLEDGGLGREKEAEYASRIAGEARRLARLIENVLDLARVEQGARQLDLAPAPLGAVVVAAVESFRGSEDGRRAGKIELDDASSGARCLLDADALEQVLTNLLTNAVKYSPEGAPVVVRCVVAATGREARAEVVDRGRGLSSEERRRLFEPFYRARPEDARATGVGIGLVVAFELAKLLGGRLEVESEPGRGSTFALVLPLVTAAP